MKDSVLFYSVTVEEGAQINSSVLMPGAVVKAGAQVNYAIVAENAIIEENAVVGAPEQSDPEIAVIAAGISIGAGGQVASGAMVTENVKGGVNA